MSTAWELREPPKGAQQSSALAELQRHDALEQLAKSKPATAFPLRLQRSTVLALVCTTLVLALLILLPNPMTAILSNRPIYKLVWLGRLPPLKKNVGKSMPIHDTSQGKATN